MDPEFCPLEYSRSLLDGFPLWTAFAAIFSVLGVYFAVRAMLNTRTPQGSVAWIFSLLFMPFVAVPAYYIFGKRKFEGYIEARRRENKKFRSKAEVPDFYYLNAEKSQIQCAELKELSYLAELPVCRNTKAEALVDGKNFFKKLFSAIESAQEYILLEFYILRGDRLGTRLKKLLIKKASEGVKVFVLYDRIGSFGLQDNFATELRRYGCQIFPFLATKDPFQNFQINFRNHRKIAVIDGGIGFLGGMNIGDEYYEGSEELGPWHDLQIQLEGPAVGMIQLSFLEDWYWVTNQVPKLRWRSEPSKESNDSEVLILPSGPADRLDSGSLNFCSLINLAKKSIRIETPYFAPDEAITSSLQLALARGVNVQVIVPKKPDHFFVDWILYSYANSLEDVGVEFHRYRTGFLHQKVVLIDEQISYVGSANFDNRSFRLNFEIGAVLRSHSFNMKLQQLFESDLEQSEHVSLRDSLEKRPSLRFKSSLARLFFPVI